MADFEDRAKEWEENILKKHLEKHPESRENFITTSSEVMKRLYTPKDLGKFEYFDKLGFPGEYPFTRGVQPTMYRGRLWTMRQFAGFGGAPETNQRYKYLLAHGEIIPRSMDMIQTMQCPRASSANAVLVFPRWTI